MFLYSRWISLPLHTRIAVASQFGIIKRGPTEVFNNTIKSDGYLIGEVEEALNEVNLLNYLKIEIGPTHAELFDLTLRKMEGKDELVVEPTPEPVPEVPVIVEKPLEVIKTPKKKGGRPKKIK